MSNVKRGVYILPNLFTSANLFFGFYAIIHAIRLTINNGVTYHICGYYIVIAALFDMMDGRVARKTNTASRFGIEYDSLCDLVSFGMAPALVTYLWLFQSLGRLGWVICFLYVACAALRLGRFNVQAISIENKHFQGLPVPMAALVFVGFLHMWRGQDINSINLPFLDPRTIILFTMFFISLLMVSSIPYRSTKSMSLTRRLPFYSMFLVVLAIVLMAFNPVWVIIAPAIGYALSGTIEYLIRLILKKPMQQVPHKAKKDETKEVHYLRPKP